MPERNQHTMKALQQASLLWLGLVALTRAESELASDLRPASELVSNCYNFPVANFDTFNSVKGVYGSSPHLVIETGSTAVDFTLHDTDGNPWNLGDALRNGQGKPVVLMWGMSTCPAYQGLDSEGSSNRWTYWHQAELVKSHGDSAIFVHVYGPEPHPCAPDTNFDSGNLLPNYWSTAPQTFTYKGRLQSARAIREITHPDQVILPDYLPDNPYSDLNQPAWCSYAMGARSAVMITASGTVFYQQDWLNTDDLADAIDGYWEQGGTGTWDGGSETSPLGSPSTKRSRPRASGAGEGRNARARNSPRQKVVTRQP